MAPQERRMTRRTLRSKEEIKTQMLEAAGIAASQFAQVRCEVWLPLALRSCMRRRCSPSKPLTGIVSPPRTQVLRGSAGAPPARA